MGWDYSPRWTGIARTSTTCSNRKKRYWSDHRRTWWPGNSKVPISFNYRRSFFDFSSASEHLDHSQRYRFRASIPKLAPDPPSPTSSGIGAAINVLTKPGFTINWANLKEDYYSVKNSSLCTRFEQMDRNLREEIKKDWIADMEHL